MRSIFLLSLVLIIVLATFVYFVNPLATIIVFVLSILLYPVFASISLIALLPLDITLKYFVIRKTKSILSGAKNLKIIGIAGSYGKTTMKNILTTILSEKMKVLATPESINTPIGIGLWFNKIYSKQSEILIIELGEEYEGDNKRISDIFPLDFVLITGINEAHIARMGSIEKITDTIFEAVKYSRSTAKVFLNIDDKNVNNSYKRRVDGRAYHMYGFSGDSEIKIDDSKFDSDKLIWQADLLKIGKISTKILGRYALADIACATMVAEELGLNDNKIGLGITKIEPVEHRLKPTKSADDILIIDDAYNGNPTGVSEAIDLLGRFKDRRKLYITPGLVEGGTMNEKIHIDIGKQLAEVADKVILIKNSATPFIAKGLETANFPKDDIVWFDTAPKAHSALKEILKPNDVILFQNDWGDQYL